MLYPEDVAGFDVLNTMAMKGPVLRHTGPVSGSKVNGIFEGICNFHLE
jgi:hypothetical protein